MLWTVRSLVWRFIYYVIHKYLIVPCRQSQKQVFIIPKNTRHTFFYFFKNEIKSHLFWFLDINPDIHRIQEKQVIFAFKLSTIYDE